MREQKCRFCDNALKYIFADLGMSPLSNSFVRPEELYNKESFYPLCAYICDNCFLVQLQEFESPERIFSDYAYFSSYSDSWLEHAKDYAGFMIECFGFNENSQVVEAASNDGYLLQYFKEVGIPVLGVEPAANVAEVAKAKGIPTIVDFFGVRLAQEMAARNEQADLIIANNVLAHVPDLHDFVGGFKILLKPRGVITVEFPYLLKLMLENQFDTIYHEHFSYFSMYTVSKAFESHGFKIFGADELSTHGGSLRIYACHIEDDSRSVSPQVIDILEREKSADLKDLKTYQNFSEQVKETKRKILEFMIQAKREGKTIVGYGAPAKGNTLLNYCGIRTDFLDYTVDRSPHKQGLYLPGTHIPIKAPDKIRETKPDYIFVLPWNLKDEIMEQMSDIREWGGRFIIPIPDIAVV